MAIYNKIHLLAALVVCASILSAPIARAAPMPAHMRRADFTLQNGKDAQALNAKFAGLKASDSCTDGDAGCVEGGFAQCVGGTWSVTKCSGGLQCFALPLVNSKGTSTTCDTLADAEARIAATGAQGGVTGDGSTPSAPASSSADSPAPSASASSSVSEDPDTSSTVAPASSSTDAATATATASASTKAASSKTAKASTTAASASTAGGNGGAFPISVIETIAYAKRAAATDEESGATVTVTQTVMRTQLVTVTRAPAAAATATPTSDDDDTSVLSSASVVRPVSEPAAATQTKVLGGIPKDDHTTVLASSSAAAVRPASTSVSAEDLSVLPSASVVRPISEPAAAATSKAVSGIPKDDNTSLEPATAATSTSASSRFHFTSAGLAQPATATPAPAASSDVDASDFSRLLTATLA